MQKWRLGFQVEKNWVLKEEDGKKFHYLRGYASDTAVDRDGDRMSPQALKSMKSAIESGMNLFSNHEHGWKDTLGVISKAEERNGGLWMEVRLEDPIKNKDVDLLLHKLEIGEKMGLSIGGDMVGSHSEKSANGKSVRVIDDVKLYEVSVVGLPSNPNSYVLGSVYKSLDYMKQETNRLLDMYSNDILPPEQPDEKQDAFAARPEGPMGYREEDASLKVKAKAETVENTTLKTSLGNGKQMNPSEDKWKDFTPQELSIVISALKALASAGGGEQPIQGGTLPPAMTAPKPTIEGKDMTQSTKKDLAGATPAVGATTSQSPDDPKNQPGAQDIAQGGTAVGDKGSFKPTTDLSEEDIGKTIAKLEEDEDEEAKKALVALKALKAKREETGKMDSEAKFRALQETYHAGKKAEEALKRETVKREETLARLKEEMGMVPPVATPEVPAAQPLPVPEAKVEQVPGAAIPVGPAPAVPPEGVTDEDVESIKALREVVGGLVDKHFGKSFPQGVVQFRKEFDDVLAQVSQPKGGTENMTNVASPGQPPGKISAIPGKSGSSEVFRTDTGKAFSQDDIFNRALKNPASTLETAKDVPIATYDEATHITSGGGYQPALLRNAPQPQFKGRRAMDATIHKSYADYLGIKLTPTADKRMEKRTLPVLKHLQANNTISQEDIAKLVAEGKIVDSLVKIVEPKEQDTFLAKHLKRVYK